MKVKIGVSARHVHLTKNDIDQLFGLNYKLSNYKNLSQPDQFAAMEKVSIKTDKNIIDNVRVLGPTRDYSQVEISKTDAYYLGLKPPVRESGDIKNSESVELVGPKGSVLLKEGCIIASRHIHIRPRDIEKLGLMGVTNVSVLLGNEKSTILENVSLKVSSNYAYELHIDTDDANASLVSTGDIANIIVK